MTGAISRRAYWGVLTSVLALVFHSGLFAQSGPAAASTPASSVARDLNLTLAELTRLAPATNQDLADLQQQGGRLRWMTSWLEENAYKAKMTAALSRNLQFAVPNLIHDVQASGGSISTTFKLYQDLTVVCHSLDSLLPRSSLEGHNKFTALNYDLSSMNRLREELASYIQQAAASIESKNPQPVSWDGRSPKKITDETIPEKPLPRKRRLSNQ